MLARAAVVCALVCSASSAFADEPVTRRPVAIIVLAANDGDLGGKAVDLDNALNNHGELAALIQDPGLHDLIRDEDADLKKLAADKLKEASDALDNFEFKNARDRAIEGQGALYGVAPPDAARVYADLALVLGQARLGLRDAKGAGEAFVLVHALAPDRTLDPAHYLPEVVAAFEKAKIPTATGKLVVGGSKGELWVDGRKVGDVGDTPAAFDVTVGVHLVQLDGPERGTAGLEVTIPPDDPKSPKQTDITISNVTLSDSVRLHRLRLQIAKESDPLARAAEVSKIADMVAVKDAILLSRDADGTIQYETWKDDTFVAPEAYGDTDPTKILDKIQPPKPPVIAKRKEYPIPLPKHETPWYFRPKYYLPALGSVVTFIVVTVALTRGQGTVDMGPGLSGVPGTHW